MPIYTPYTYLIGWSELNIWYYGSRYARKTSCIYESGCHPDDLWVTYFTSSLHVKDFIEIYGNPDIVKIRKTFPAGSKLPSIEEINLLSRKALDWEEKFLRRINAIVKQNWLNKNIAGSFKTTESTQNPLRNKTYTEVYGIEKAKEWSENQTLGLIRHWNSNCGQIKKNLFRDRAKDETSKETHIMQTDPRFTQQNKIRIENKTHNWLGPEHNLKLIKEGKHNLLGPEVNLKRIKEGNHNLVGMVPCIDLDGNFVSVTKEIYNSQIEDKNKKYYVHIMSHEGKRRKLNRAG